MCPTKKEFTNEVLRKLILISKDFSCTADTIHIVLLDLQFVDIDSWLPCSHDVA